MTPTPERRREGGREGRREGGREGAKERRRKSECLCLFSALRYSGAWELRQLGRALRNILSCNVNMSELWSGVALPSSTLSPVPSSQFNPALCVSGVCQWHQEPTFSFPERGNDPGENGPVWSPANKAALLWTRLFPGRGARLAELILGLNGSVW